MSRSRVSTGNRIDRIAAAHGGRPTTDGALAAEKWLHARGHVAPVAQRWHVQIRLGLDAAEPVSDFDEAVATRFHIDLYSEEWGVYFCHAGHASWIRVTDIAFVHGRDDFRLLPIAPTLANVGSLLRRIEHDQAIRFRREHAAVHTNLSALEMPVRSWLLTL